MVAALGTAAYDLTKSRINSVTISNALNNAIELASSLESQLNFTAQSIAMTNALYATKLFPTITLAVQPSFREYYFGNSTCGGSPPSSTNCPLDYGDLPSRSRIPLNVVGFGYGSVAHSSVYLFDSSAGQAARTDAVWNNLISNHPVINTAINAFAVQDLDMGIMYNKGPLSNLFFYHSVQVPNPPYTNYYSVHRTFPGTQKNDPAYDATLRPWFSRAPVNGYYVYGPYVETFTQEFVLTISSKQIIGSGSTATTVVAAAVILLNELTNLMEQIQIPDGGFAALITQTNTLVFWNGTNVYDYSNTAGNAAGPSFFSLSKFNPSFYNAYMAATGVDKSFTYTDANGVSWIVGAIPLFPSEDNKNLNAGFTNTFTMFVFANVVLAEAPLPPLLARIKATTIKLEWESWLAVGLSCLVILVFSQLVLNYVVTPLKGMKRVSKLIVQIAGEEERKRDYSKVLQDDLFRSSFSREDEIGNLIYQFNRVVNLLNFRAMQKRMLPKYPPNPFYNESVTNYNNLTWNIFFDKYKREGKISVAMRRQSENRGPVDKPQATNSLDVLHGMMMNNAPSAPTPSKDKAVAVDVEMVNIVRIGGAPPVMPTLPARKKVSNCSNLKIGFYSIAVVLLIGLFGVVFAASYELFKSGLSWVDQVIVDMGVTQNANTQAIVYSKAQFVNNFFSKEILDLQVVAGFATNVLDQTITVSGLPAGSYLPSYCLDYNNPNAASGAYGDAVQGLSYNFNGASYFSGYFSPNFVGCAPSQCSSNQMNTQTKLASLWDLRFGALYNSLSNIQFLQVGLETNAFFVNYPYVVNSQYTNAPTQCYVQDTTSPACAALYSGSKCNPTSGSNNYPYYTPQCRNWYTFGLNHTTPGNIYFLYPRISSSGAYVITSVTPLTQNSSATGTLYGVLNSNTYVNTLSNEVNRLKILENGYTFVLDSYNSTNIIVHPLASNTCGLLSCAEQGWLAGEYDSFYQTVLLPMQQNALSGSNSVSVASNYLKGGVQWNLEYNSIALPTSHYTVVAVVPVSDIKKAAENVSTSVRTFLYIMIAVFIILTIAFFGILIWFMGVIIHKIIDPVNDLAQLCELIANDKEDINYKINNKEISSLDMKILMRAFSNLVVALKFGNDTFNRGDKNAARIVFKDSLELFTHAGNQMGVGASLNNLAAVELGFGNFAEAIRLYNESIVSVENMLKVPNLSPADILRLKKICSDRKGNLSLAYLESGNYKDAFDLLEKLLEEDKSLGYVRGCVVKQGTLGNYYLKQGEFSSAQKLFISALAFTQSDTTSFDPATWNKEEAAASNMIALSNIAALHQAKKDPLAESVFLEALIKSPSMHVQTVTKILSSLRNIYNSSGRVQDALDVVAVANANDFVIDVTQKGALRTVTKSIFFALDYSGSMAGGKIKAAVSNLQKVFDQHLSDGDEAMLVHFNNVMVIDFAMSIKSKQNTAVILNKIASLTSPQGGTAFYDAIRCGLDTFSKKAKTHDENFIIALTDGDDNSSNKSISVAQIASMISSTEIGLIIIGVGDDVKANELQQLTSASKKGFYIAAQGDVGSINEAFGKVAALIQGEVMMEEV